MADKGIPFDVPTRANLLQGQRLIDEQLREKSAKDAKLSPLDKAYAALEAARTFGSGILATVGSLPTRAIKGEDAAQEYINQRMYIPTREKAMDYVGNVANFLEQLETKYKMPPVLPEAVALQNVMGPAAKQATKQAAKAAKPVVGKALEEYMFKQGLALPATVYHGSPHKFEKFDSSKIGTGEGAQAYGHGMYLAQEPKVAQEYQFINASVNPDEVTYNGKSLESLYNASYAAQDRAHRMPNGPAKRAAIEKANAEAGFWEKIMTRNHPKLVIDDALNPDNGWPAQEKFAKSLDLKKFGGVDMNPGNLYKTDLPDEKIAKMLDWDKPLSQQTPEVQKIAREADLSGAKQGSRLRGVLEAWREGRDVGVEAKGADLHHALTEFGNNNQAGVAEMFRNAGIPGIRYLDADSRAAGKGTSNFVVFPGEEDALTILERNQQPIKKESTRLADNPDAMMMEVEDQKFGIGGMAGKAVKSAIATRELEKQAVLRAEAAAKSAAKQALMPQYNEAVKGMTQKQDPLSFEQWKAINYPEPEMAEGGAVFNTDPDMSDGGQIIQGAPFKHGGDVNLDAMYMAVNDAKFRRK
jgi:hypothetical protein